MKNEKKSLEKKLETTNDKKDMSSINKESNWLVAILSELFGWEKDEIP